RQVLSSRYLNYYGLGESQLAESLDDLIQSQENPTIGTYSKHNVLTLRLTASGSDEGTTQALLDTLEETINDRLGAYYYGQGLDYMPSQALVQTLKTQQKTVSVAESLTGGM
ncbi:competence/damage-inducible protein A, partial [Aerococcus urinae]|nr:competence/damage-inducible protein A [Aerococcus urinae]